MCARLLSCPLCSQPGFATLDSLRAGLVSVATRSLPCPVCDETLLGIDKLTIHLFGHAISNECRRDIREETDVRNDTNPENPTTGVLQNWNASGDPGGSCERIRGEETATEEIVFVPGLNSNLNAPRSVTTIIVDKNPDSSDTNDDRCYGSLAEKNQDRMIFVPNSSRQFSSRPMTRRDDSFSTIISDGKTCDAAVSTESHGSFEKKRESNRVKMYREESTGNKSAVHDSEPKEEITEEFSETWIENLLQDNSEKRPVSSSQEPRTNLTNVEEKYSNYRPTQIFQNENSNGNENRADSQDSNVRSTEESFCKDQPSNQNSIVLPKDVLPQLKALRLLAVKDKTERCDICGIPVPDLNILILHKQVVHMIAEEDVNAMPDELLKNYPCHFCTKIFKNRGSLMVHTRIAHIGYNLGNSIIGVDSGTSSRDKDNESSLCENGYNCPTCGKNFKKEQHVTQHLKTHEGKQWECDVCSKMFTTKYFLKKHKRLHSGEMPYKCTICDKTFTFQQSYHKHRLYHKDDKPHTCTTCGRSFKELSTLHNHERIHTGEKPFACETCGKCFRQRVSYLVHRRIHTGVMPYNCVACGKNFRYKVSQRTHKCPIQPEVPIPLVPEVGSTNSATTSNFCNNSTSIAEPTVFMESRTIPEVSMNENKFILTVNTQGQPILTRESEIRQMFLEDKKNVNSSVEEKVNDEKADDSWNNLSSKNVSKESSGTFVVKKSGQTDSKLLNDENDFFSLVMSPLENDLSSPSTQMEHLHLSSPKNDDDRQETNSREKNDTNGTNVLQNDLNNAIEGIIRENCTGNDALETINEESLKQLLYGIDRKI